MVERIEDAIVLYVDDEWTNRVVFEQNFGAKFRVKAVGSGPDALETLKSEPVAVIVADQRMPEMTGNDLLRQVKERYPKVVRVVVTAYADQDPLLKAVNEGLVARYIIKPWTRSEIERTLEWALDAWRHFGEQSEIHLRLLRSERLITLGVIASAIFHDFGQPVGYLVNNAQRLAFLVGSWPELVTLVKAHAAEVPEPHRTLLLQLAEEMPALAGDLDTGIKLVESMRHDVDRILNPSGRRPIPITQDPLVVIRYVTSIFQRRRPDLKLAYEGPSVLPKLAIGTTELAQVLINLASNALQAFGAPPWKPPEGARVVLHAVEEKDVVRLAVEDNGRGMEADVAAKAGTLFFSTRDDGSGLGLAQCRRLVEAAKGTLIGQIQIKNLDWSVPKGELAYLLDRDSEGRGYMTEVFAAILRVAFGELALEKVFLRAIVGNERSARLARRFAFAREGVLREEFATLDGRRVDLEYYGLLARDLKGPG